MTLCAHMCCTDAIAINKKVIAVPGCTTTWPAHLIDGHLIDLFYNLNRYIAKTENIQKEI